MAAAASGPGPAPGLREGPPAPGLLALRTAGRAPPARGHRRRPRSAAPLLAPRLPAGRRPAPLRTTTRRALHGHRRARGGGVAVPAKGGHAPRRPLENHAPCAAGARLQLSASPALLSVPQRSSAPLNAPHLLSVQPQCLTVPLSASQHPSASLSSLSASQHPAVPRASPQSRPTHGSAGCDDRFQRCGLKGLEHTSVPSALRLH